MPNSLLAGLRTNPTQAVESRSLESFFSGVEIEVDGYSLNRGCLFNSGLLGGLDSVKVTETLVRPDNLHLRSVIVPWFSGATLVPIGHS